MARNQFPLYARITVRNGQESASSLGKNIHTFKENLEEMYVFACGDPKTSNGTKEVLKQTWEALSAELEADIKMQESLQVH